MIGHIFIDLCTHCLLQYALRRLFTMDGIRVELTKDLLNGAYYVAAGLYSGFKKAEYGADKPLFNATIRFKPR